MSLIFDPEGILFNYRPGYNSGKYVSALKRFSPNPGIFGVKMQAKATRNAANAAFLGLNLHSHS